MIHPEYFYNLLDFAMQDLSAAHLNQHFTVASMYRNILDTDFSDQGTWSALKPKDTVTYINGKLTGTKHWVSGVSKCNWVVIAVKENNDTIIVLVDPTLATILPAPTVGMEDTLTVHLEFNQTPAVKVCQRQDPRCFIADSVCDLGFITNQLGLTRATFNDIDAFTQDKNIYAKRKLSLELDILEMLWQQEVQDINNSEVDHNTFWNRRLKVYAYSKFVLVNVVNFVTEMTGSGLFEPTMPTHQRFKDAVIYASHQRNLNLCLTQLYQ